MNKVMSTKMSVVVIKSQAIYYRKFESAQKTKTLFLSALENGRRLLDEKELQIIHDSERRHPVCYDGFCIEWNNVSEKFEIPISEFNYLHIEEFSLKIHSAIEAIIKKIEDKIFILNDNSSDINPKTFAINWIPMANKRNRCLGEYCTLTTFRDPRYPFDFALSIDEGEKTSNLQVEIHINYAFYKNK